MEHCPPTTGSLACVCVCGLCVCFLCVHAWKIWSRRTPDAHRAFKHMKLYISDTTYWSTRATHRIPRGCACILLFSRCTFVGSRSLRHHTHACVRACMYHIIHTCLHGCAHTKLHAHVLGHTHTHTYTHTLSHTHTNFSAAFRKHKAQLCRGIHSSRLACDLFPLLFSSPWCLCVFRAFVCVFVALSWSLSLVFPSP